jgi:hypothetical protein
MRGAHARVGGVGRAGVWHARTIRGGGRREDPGDTWGAHGTASGERRAVGGTARMGMPRALYHAHGA